MGKMLSYQIIGQGDVITFIHGFCEDLSIWKHAHKYFPNHSILSIDLPGFGKSKILDDQTIPNLASSIRGLFKELDIKSSHIVGHSLGGYVALEIAKQKQSIVKSLTLFHSNIFEDSEEKKANRNKTIEFIQKHGVKNFANSFIGTLFYEENREDNKEVISNLNKIVQSTSKEAVIATTKAMRDRVSYEGVIKELKQPVLFVVGKNDQAVTLTTSLQQIHLPKNSQVVFLDKTGHMGMFEQEKKTYTTINAFVSLN